MKNKIIAIDGYASTGKSAIAKHLAERLNFMYVDSGAMYRMIAWASLQENCFEKDVLDISKLENILEKITISFKEEGAKKKLVPYLNGVNVADKIRGIRVSNVVGKVAAHPKVRKKLVFLQRAMSKNKSVVMDGRDIGTVVFPNADLKFFITCDAQIRAKRRYEELKKKGHAIHFQQVLESITQRDLQDTTRKDSPLVKPENALEIDNSQMNLKTQLDYIYELVRKLL